LFDLFGGSKPQAAVNHTPRRQYRWREANHRFVLAGLVPAIHVFFLLQDVDARDKPGHDDPIETE
jgi:hypothetical protein